MLLGDSLETAIWVGKECGMLDPESRILSPQIVVYKLGQTSVQVLDENGAEAEPDFDGYVVFLP